MIERITVMGKNATIGDMKFCQECLMEHWKGYNFFFQDLYEQSFFVCDECLKKARAK